MKWEINKIFELTISKYCGAKHAILVDSCTNAIFLCCKYLKVKTVTIPKHTYISVANSIINAGGNIRFMDIEWYNNGMYNLEPYNIIDAALLFHKNMYIPKSYMCLSFQSKKKLPIGKGGAILTDDDAAADWFQLARSNGKRFYWLEPEIIGYNMYMTQEQAARGLDLFYSIKHNETPIINEYPDISQYQIYTSNNI